MKPSAIIISRILALKGIKHTVLSPGSRSAPLAMAIAENPELHVTTIVDERSAAFVAFGIARQLRQPVALVCTSGTALLNYAPALAEALYQGIPLLVFSADRPMQWIDQDDSQTIHQFRALENVVKASYDIPDFNPADGEMDWYANRTVNEAIITACEGKSGPVHINCQYNTPLTSGNRGDEAMIETRGIELVEGGDALDHETSVRLAQELAECKVLIVAGYMPPNHKLTRILRCFLALPNVALLPEALANLHLQGYGGIDKVITVADVERRRELLPDIVITIGGAVVSRKVKEWLREAPVAMRHWSIGKSDYLADCFQHLSRKITVGPTRFFAQVGRLMSKVNLNSDYSQKWRDLREEAIRSQYVFLSTTPWSDLLAQSILYSQIPSSWSVYCSNGTCVRYAELFASSYQQQLCSNRGTSGIEGVTSTAVGSAMAYNGTTLLVTGDMSLRHDMAGLTPQSVPSDFKIVVFSNRGGDIFRFIPSTRDVKLREELFTLSDFCSGDFVDIAKAFGFRYLAATDVASFTDALRIMKRNGEKTLLEVITDSEINARVLTDYLNRNF